MRRDHREPLRDLVFEEGSFSSTFFRCKKTREACEIFLNWLKSKGGEVSPKELSRFTRDLEVGKIVEGFSFSRKSCYNLVARLRNLGFLGKESRFDSSRRRRTRYVYAVVPQVVPLRAPQRRGSWVRKTWEVSCEWNAFVRECEEWSARYNQSESVLLVTG